jgi:hypothetical protein
MEGTCLAQITDDYAFQVLGGKYKWKGALGNRTLDIHYSCGVGAQGALAPRLFLMYCPPLDIPITPDSYTRTLLQLQERYLLAKRGKLRRINYL